MYTHRFVCVYREREIKNMEGQLKKNPSSLYQFVCRNFQGYYGLQIMDLTELGRKSEECVSKYLLN